MVPELILGLCLGLGEAWTNTTYHKDLNETPRFQTGFRPSLWTGDIFPDDSCRALFCSPLSAPGELSNGGRLLFAFGDVGKECPFQRGVRTEAARNSDFKTPQPTLYQFMSPNGLETTRKQLFEMKSKGTMTMVRLDSSNAIEAQLTLEEVPGSDVFSGPLETIDPTLDVSLFSANPPHGLPSLLFFNTAEISDVGSKMSSVAKTELSLTDVRLIVVHQGGGWFSTSDQIVEISDGGKPLATMRTQPSANTLQAEMAAVGCLLSKEGNRKAGRLVTLSFLIEPLMPSLDATTCQPNI